MMRVCGCTPAQFSKLQKILVRVAAIRHLSIRISINESKDMDIQMEAKQPTSYALDVKKCLLYGLNNATL